MQMRGGHDAPSRAMTLLHPASVPPESGASGLPDVKSTIGRASGGTSGRVSALGTIPQRRHINVPKIETRDGTELYVKDWGSGRPVILMHGWPLSLTHGTISDGDRGRRNARDRLRSPRVRSLRPALDRIRLRYACRRSGGCHRGDRRVRRGIVGFSMGGERLRGTCPATAEPRCARPD